MIENFNLVSYVQNENYLQLVSKSLFRNSKFVMFKFQLVSRLFSYNWYVICLLINWYQDVLFSIDIWMFNASFTFISIGIIWYRHSVKCFYAHFNWYHLCTSLTHFLIGIMFVVTLYWFFVLNKKGENILFLLLPLCWWLTKRGRRIWVCSLYACFCMHVLCFY